MKVHATFPKIIWQPGQNQSIISKQAVIIVDNCYMVYKFKKEKKPEKSQNAKLKFSRQICLKKPDF